MPRSQCLSNINSAVAILYVMHDHTLHAFSHSPALPRDFYRLLAQEIGTKRPVKV